MTLLFPHSAQVKRDTALGTNGRKTKQVIGTESGLIFIPMPSRVEIENQFSVGTGWDVYAKDKDVDIRSGDQLVHDGATFNVRRVARYDVQSVGHLHILATREGN